MEVWLFYIRKMSRISSILLLVSLLLILGSSCAQVRIDEDIDDTGDMGVNFEDEQKYYGQDWNNNRRNYNSLPDDRGIRDTMNKSPYDDDDLDHQGHEHSTAYTGSASRLSIAQLILPFIVLLTFQL